MLPQEYFEILQLLLVAPETTFTNEKGKSLYYYI